MPVRKQKVKSRYRVDDGVMCLDIRLNSPFQLFDQRDPAPFRDKDLEDDAAKYIIGSMREIGLKGPVKLVVHLPDRKEGDVTSSQIENAIHSYFSHEVFLSRQKLALNFKHSQIAMLIGLSCLFLFIFLSHQLGDYSDNFWAQMAKEGFNIIGWVAMWRPVELTLYAWWPIWQEVKLFEHLSKIEVEVNRGSALTPILEKAI